MRHQLGFIESLRYSELGNAVGSLASTKNFRSADFDFALPYHNQTGVIRDGAGDSRTFEILSGVRQGCVLSPGLFCAALELAMSEWRFANPEGGINLASGYFFGLVCVLQMTSSFLRIRGKRAKSIKYFNATFGSGKVGAEQFKDRSVNNGFFLCAHPGQDSDVEHHLQQAAKAV